MPKDDKAAEAFLDDQISKLAKKAGGQYDPENDDDMRRLLVDFIRCLRTLRRLSNKIDTLYNVKTTGKIVSYLQT